MSKETTNLVETIATEIEDNEGYRKMTRKDVDRYVEGVTGFTEDLLDAVCAQIDRDGYLAK
jgi:hypothetical protein